MTKISHLPYLFKNPNDKGAEGEQRWKDVTVGLCREICQHKRCRILDFGSGRGELLHMLINEGYEAIGADADPKCVELSSRFATCHLINGPDLGAIFGANSFDIVIALHVLEHLDSPKAYVESLKQVSTKFLVFGVPNLGAVTNIQFVRVKNVNEGHMHGWDFNHFRNFMERHCGLQLIKWVPDYVVAPKISPLLHKLGFRVLVEERLLPKLFPYQSNSIIGLFQKDGGGNS